MKYKESKELIQTLRGCQQGLQSAQKDLYYNFYNYAMGVLLRYTKSREEAQEVLNDAFIKVFKQVHTFKLHLSFKSWFRRILIHAAIDHYRRNEKHYHSLDISYLSEAQVEGDMDATISAEEILDMVQQLPPTYRLVFNLFAIEGFSHQEISQKLGISIGASKSNLSKARVKLRKMLNNRNTEAYGIHYG